MAWAVAPVCKTQHVFQIPANSDDNNRHFVRGGETGVHSLSTELWGIHVGGDDLGLPVSVGDSQEPRPHSTFRVAGLC